MTQRNRLVLALDELEHTDDAHDFVGAEHGDVPFGAWVSRPRR